MRIKYNEKKCKMCCAMYVEWFDVVGMELAGLQ
jgi:hypothetical protein